MCLAAATATAQDPVKGDSKHCKVEFENAQVRVLRIHYGPHEKSMMHDHPPGVLVFLTDGTLKVHLSRWENGGVAREGWRSAMARR